MVFVSLDGIKEAYDQVRGKGSYDTTRSNILYYIKRYSINGYKECKDIWLSLTINSINYRFIEDYIKEWYGIVNKVAVQFHTQFIDDHLMLRFGYELDRVIDELLMLSKKYPNFIANKPKQLNLLRKSWGQG